MNSRATVAADGETITIHIPMTFRKRGGRKMVLTPDGSPWAPRPRVDNAMVKALARAFRWQRMLDDGVCATIEELASRERVNRGYMSRVLRLTLLAPDIVEAMLDGRQSEGMRLERLLEGVPSEWDKQRSVLCAQLPMCDCSELPQPINKCEAVPAGSGQSRNA